MKIICSVSLLLDFFSLSLYFFINCTHTLSYALLCQGLHRAPQYGNKVRTLLQYSLAPRTYSIICIGSESCLWSIVGLSGSCAYYLTFRYIGYGSKGRTTAIVSWFIRMTTSVEKSKNWLSLCGVSWSADQEVRNLLRFFRLMRRTGLHPIRCLQHPSPD